MGLINLWIIKKKLLRLFRNSEDSLSASKVSEIYSFLNTYLTFILY